MNTLNLKLSVMIFSIFTAFALSSCSKDDNSPNKTSHKIIFKAEASNGSLINLAVYGYDTDLQTVSSIDNQTWTSAEITVPGTANVATIAANAVGANASSTLKVQIYVDGVLKKEGTSTGTALSATAQHNLK